MFNFDFSNGYVVLRIVVGLFLIPHILGKVTAREAVEGFFGAAGLKPASTWRLVAMATEIVLCICLVLGIFTQYAAIVTALFMLVAAGAVWRVSKGKWLWNIGGAEYPLFWGICAAIVAVYGPRGF